MAAEEAPSANPAPDGRCAFFVERKRRFCKMIPAQGRRFCGEHSGQEEESSKRRIPCPLDPKHTVYEDKLQKHLKKCNSREKPKPTARESLDFFQKGELMASTEVYYVQDINAGSTNATELPGEQVPISALSKEDLEDLIRKLRKSTKGINYILKDQILSHHSLQDALNDPRNGDAAFKHLKQQASILGNMERLHLLQGGNCFVEFGAGRGKLSHWVDVALQDTENVHFLLVERATTRFKVDGKHRKSLFERLQVDIQHLCLSKVPALMEKKLRVIGIGKHVCGAATDLALRCLTETYTRLSDDQEEDPQPKRFKTNGANVASDNSDATYGKPEVKSVAGIVIALCCHHRCDWKSYVGQEFFRRVGLGAVEFNYFKRMTSWATCGMRGNATETATDVESKERRHEAEEHDQEANSAECTSDNLQGLLTNEERKQIGLLCKRLIDHGRIEYLQQKGYEAVLQHYTDLNVSLENVLLTAVPC